MVTAPEICWVFCQYKVISVHSMHYNIFLCLDALPLEPLTQLFPIRKDQLSQMVPTSRLPSAKVVAIGPEPQWVNYSSLFSMPELCQYRLCTSSCLQCDVKCLVPQQSHQKDSSPIHTYSLYLYMSLCMDNPQDMVTQCVVLPPQCSMILSWILGQQSLSLVLFPCPCRFPPGSPVSF